METLYLSAYILLYSLGLLSIVVLPWLLYGLWVRRRAWIFPGS